MEHKTIAFIGAGNMARSIISGLLKQGYPGHLITATARTDESLTKLKATCDVNTMLDNHKAAQQAEVIVLAVKPQMMRDVCEKLADIDFGDKLVITIAAGIKAQRYHEWLDDKLNLVRVMPNTPALVGLGMSGLYAESHLDAAYHTFAGEILAAVGEVCWVKNEEGINSITAVSGSAPAYFFRFMEAIQEEALALGFDKQTARLLVQQVALGSAQLVAHNPDTELSTLREQVTSKGGTTAEALRVFNEHALSEIVAKAMQAAIIRAEEMEKLF